MDFTLISKKENRGICYKLLKANFYRNYYVIIAQSRDDFSCGSFHRPFDEAIVVFDEICDSSTEPYTLMGILQDIDNQRIKK